MEKSRGKSLKISSIYVKILRFALKFLTCQGNVRIFSLVKKILQISTFQVKLSLKKITDLSNCLVI